MAYRSRRRCEHAKDALLVQDLALFRVIQRGSETNQVHGRGDPSAVGIHGFDALHAVGQRRLLPIFGPEMALPVLSPSSYASHFAGGAVFQKFLALLHAANTQRDEDCPRTNS